MKTFTDVPCPGCGCVCDDLSLTFDGTTLTEFAPNCRLGEAWFRSHADDRPVAPQISGAPASLDEAIEAAAQLLNDSDYPLVYGLSRSATPGQRAAVALAERLGAAIDTTASLCHGPSIMALQQVGEVTSTLGEIRNRADLVIFWGCDPATSHPRHADRYSVFPAGRHVPAGRTDRTVVMVGDASRIHDFQLAPDGSRPDHVIPLAPGTDYEALTCLRAMLAGQSVDDPPEDLVDLLNLMRQCQYGVVFFGLGIAESPMWDGDRQSATGHVNVAALLQLVADLNQETRFTARRMRLQGDVSGADNVLCWQSGYPFGVDYSRGYPRYGPGEFTAADLLERGDVDACVLIGTETLHHFSAAALQHLQSIPVIVIDYPTMDIPWQPAVSIPTAVYGIHAPGTVFRMDNVPLALKPLLPSRLPTDEAVLNQIHALIEVDCAQEPATLLQ